MTQGRSTIGIEFEAMGGKTCQTQKTECKKEPCIRRTPVEEEDQQPAPTQSKRKVQKMKNFREHAAKVIWWQIGAMMFGQL